MYGLNFKWQMNRGYAISIVSLCLYFVMFMFSFASVVLWLWFIMLCFVMFVF